MNDIVIEDTWRDRLEAFAGGRRDLWVFAVVVAVVVIGALLLRARSAPAQVAAPATIAGPAVTSSSSPALVAGVLVHVAGAVREPGLYRLPAGARVADAIDAAGGPLRSADVDALNLAEPLVDAMKIEVVRRGRAVTSSSSPGASPGVTVVDLNTADQIALESIPGIGPVTAVAILQHRQEIGSFNSIDELLDVDGIGPATLESMRPYVTL